MDRWVGQFKKVILTEKRELEPLGSVIANCKVNSSREDGWGENTDWQLREHLGPKIGANSIHSVVRFSQEYRSLIWEDKNDILNGVETQNHDDKEKRAISVLDTSQVLADFGEENNTKASSQKCNNKLNIACLRKSQKVQKVSASEQSKLIAPRTRRLRHSVLLLFRNWLHP